MAEPRTFHVYMGSSSTDLGPALCGSPELPLGSERWEAVDPAHVCRQCWALWWPKQREQNTKAEQHRADLIIQSLSILAGLVHVVCAARVCLQYLEAMLGGHVAPGFFKDLLDQFVVPKGTMDKLEEGTSKSDPKFTPEQNKTLARLRLDVARLRKDGVDFEAETDDPKGGVQ